MTGKNFDIGTRAWHGRVWHLAAPMILSNLSVPLLGAVDTAVMGQLPEPFYLGAVAVGALIFTFIYWAFGFLRMGTTGLTSQAWGGGHSDEVRAIFYRSLIIAAALGVAIIIIQKPISELAFFLLEASAEVEGHSNTYFVIRIWGAPAALANYVIIGWFLGTQNARVPLVLQVFLNGLNILLDFIFVLKLGWEVEGVALATVIAEYSGLGLGLLLVCYSFRKSGTTTAARIFCIVRFRQMFEINRDIFIRTLCLLFCFAYFTAEGAKLGDVILGANAVLMNFLAFMSHGLDGFAHAVEALVGSAKGAGNRESFRRAVTVSVFWACVVAILFAVVYWVGGKILISILTGVPSVRAEAELYLPWLIVAPVLSVWAFLLDGIFIGTTRTVELRNAMIFSTVLYVLLVQLALPLLGNHGLWLALSSFMLLRGVSLGFYYPRLSRSIG